MKSLKKLIKYFKRKRWEKWGNYRFSDSEICACFRVFPSCYYLFKNKEDIRKRSLKSLRELKALLIEYEVDGVEEIERLERLWDR